MKFGQENKFFLGSSHHGVFSPSLIFSFGYTQPYPSLRSLVNPFILYPCTTSFILPSFILRPCNSSFIHPSFILQSCSSSFIHPSFILAVHHSSIHPCNSPFILHLCSSSFIHLSFIFAVHHSSMHHLSLQLVILSHPIFSRYCLRTLYYR